MVNLVILQGRLTRDAETRFLQNSNDSVTKFSIAVQRNYKEAGQEQAGADFINCEAWNGTGEFVEKYFRQGSMIIVQGEIRTGSYTDRDGKKVYTTNILVHKANFAGEKRQAENEEQDYNYGRPAPSNAAGDGFMNIPDGIDEELPFN